MRQKVKDAYEYFSVSYRKESFEDFTGFSAFFTTAGQQEKLIKVVCLPRKRQKPVLSTTAC